MIDIDKYLKEQLEQVEITNLVIAEIKNLISTDIRKQITKAVRDQIDILIKDEIDIYLSGPVDTDDGWGKKVYYESFEMLFKKEFNERIKATYDVKRIIEKRVSEQVKSLFTDRYEEVIDKIVSGLTIIK